MDLRQQIINEGGLTLLVVLLGFFELLLHFFNSREMRGCGVEREGLFGERSGIITEAL